MTKKVPMTPTQRAHIEHFVRTAEEERSHPVGEADVERILAEMRSEDEMTRARAVRQICPCRMSWEVFHRLRKAAKRLQNDPSPLVAANARHIEEDARRVADFEARLERVREYEEDAGCRADRRGRNLRKDRRAW